MARQGWPRPSLAPRARRIRYQLSPDGPGRRLSTISMRSRDSIPRTTYTMVSVMTAAPIVARAAQILCIGAPFVLMSEDDARAGRTQARSRWGAKECDHGGPGARVALVSACKNNSLHRVVFPVAACGLMILYPGNALHGCPRSGGPPRGAHRDPPRCA